MHWDAEMVPIVAGPTESSGASLVSLTEKTGVMQEMKNPCIVLDSVACQARYSDGRMFCPRSIYPYWPRNLAPEDHRR